MNGRILTTALTTAALACALTIAASGAVRAQQGAFCGKRDQVVAQLRDRHGEVRQSAGLQRDARVMETFANNETGSWTIIVSLPTGMACLVAAGEAFQKDAGATDPAKLDDPA